MHRPHNPNGPDIPTPAPQCALQRHSGTNYMLRFLQTNLAGNLNLTDSFCTYKHNYQVYTCQGGYACRCYCT